MGSGSSSNQRATPRQATPSNINNPWQANGPVMMPYQYPVAVAPGPQYTVQTVPYPAQDSFPVPQHPAYSQRPAGRPPHSVMYQTDRATSWTESRDRVFSRILYAEEFLNRISEQNGRIQLVSQLPDREHYQPAIVEMLGLCGHLHGELVRIHHMLAADDPQLKSIAEFEVSHSAVVDMIRGIQRQSDQVRDAASGTDDRGQGSNEKSRGHYVDGETETESNGIVGRHSRNTISVQSDPVSFSDAETQNSRRQTSDSNTSDDEVMTSRFRDNGNDVNEDMTEENLKLKHNGEAAAVAERYARKFVGSNQLSVDEVNKLITDHAETVQRLRIRQDEEKKKFNEILAAKRRERQRGLVTDDDVTETEAEWQDGDLEHLNDWQNRIDNSVDQAVVSRAGTSETGSDLAEAVRQLEALRQRGELTEDAVANLVNKYLPSAQPSSQINNRRGNRPAQSQNNDDTRESASQLVQENLLKQKEIQTKRQQEKQQLEEKLQQKLREKNQRQQMRQERVIMDNES